MTNDTEDVGSLLNELIEVCLDGEHGYRTAAADVKNSELQGIFLRYADQRAKFAKELKAEAQRLGVAPAETGTVSGALHRGWIELKAALTGSSIGSIVAACETGEDSADAAYGQAVDTAVPGQTRHIIEKQAGQVREAHQYMKHLKAETESGSAFQKNE